MAEPAPPDLGDGEQRRAYRRELRRVARGWRLAGLALLLAALALVVAAPGQQLLIGALFALSWAAMITAIVQRSRYHRRRMSGQKL